MARSDRRLGLLATGVAVGLAATMVACGGTGRPAEGQVDRAVTGYLVVDPDGVTSCERLAESFPPQCVGSGLTVIGLAADRLAQLADQSSGSISWSTRPVTLRGVVSNGTLRVTR